MNQKRFLKILLISLVVILVGIVIYFVFIQRTPGINPLTPSTVSLPNLQTAPETVLINGNEYTLETYLWRDFMPISPPDGKPLIAVVKVRAPGKTNVASEIKATRLWVVKDKDIWETEFTNEERSAVGDTLEKVARNGPKWGPGITVDVIVRVIDFKSGDEYLLKASNQSIHRTD